jgi:hypothetical protein
VTGGAPLSPVVVEVSEEDEEWNRLSRRSHALSFYRRDLVEGDAAERQRKATISQRLAGRSVALSVHASPSHALSGGRQSNATAGVLAPPVSPVSMNAAAAKQRLSVFGSGFTQALKNFVLEQEAQNASPAAAPVTPTAEAAPEKLAIDQVASAGLAAAAAAAAAADASASLVGVASAAPSSPASRGMNGADLSEQELAKRIAEMFVTSRRSTAARERAPTVAAAPIGAAASAAAVPAVVSTEAAATASEVSVDIDACVKRLKVSAADLLVALVSMDLTFLQAERVSLIRSIWPTADNSAVLQSTPRHSFLSELLRFAAPLWPRIRFLHFYFGYAGALDSLEARLDTLDTACAELEYSGNLRISLDCILTLGNLLSEGTGEPFVFRLSQLDELEWLTTSANSEAQLSLLDFVVEFINSNYTIDGEPKWAAAAANGASAADDGATAGKASVSFLSELETVRDASDVSIDALADDLQRTLNSFQDFQRGGLLDQPAVALPGRNSSEDALAASVDGSSSDTIKGTVIAFLASGVRRTSESLERLSALRERFSRLTQYFSEDPLKLAPNAFLKLFAAFFDAFERAEERAVKRRHERKGSSISWMHGAGAAGSSSSSSPPRGHIRGLSWQHALPHAGLTSFTSVPAADAATRLAAFPIATINECDEPDDE